MEFDGPLFALVAAQAEIRSSTRGSKEQNIMSRTRKCRNAIAAALIGLAVASTDAAAGWIQIADLDGSDTATNPGYPSSQGADQVGLYLKDLLNLENAPTLRDQQNGYAGGTLSGMGDTATGSQFLLAFHFGNGNSFWPHTGPFDVFFSCAGTCDTFTLPDTTGISNYRLYSAPDDRVVPTGVAVPEPATVVLLGAAMIGLGVVRRRRRDNAGLG